MEALHELIRGMSMAEKSYFKRYAGKLSEDSSTNYIQLFDAIGKQDVYDEAAIKKMFARQKFVKQFSVAKTYLYKAVIKALKNFYEESGIVFQLKSMLLEMTLLMDKGIYSQAYKVIARGIALAKEFEMFAELQEFLSAEFYLLMNNYQPGLKARDATETMAEQAEVAQKMENLFAYESLYRQQHRLNKTVYQLRDKEQLNEYNRILSNTLLEHENRAFSGRSLYYYHFIRSLHFSVTDNRKGFLSETLKLVEVCKSTTYFSRHDFRSYMNAVNLLLEASYFNGEMKTMQAGLKLLNELPVQIERDKIARFIYYSRFGLIYYDHAKDNKAKKKLITEAWDLVSMYGSKIPFHILVSLIVTYISALLEMGEYSKALDWIEVYRQGKKEDKSRYDAQAILHMMQLIAHYELNNHLLVKNIVPNIARFIRKVGQQSRFEKILIGFFTRLTSAKAAGANIFEETLKELESLKEGDILHRNRPMHDIFKVFIESKKVGRKYHEIAVP